MPIAHLTCIHNNVHCACLSGYKFNTVLETMYCGSLDNEVIIALCKILSFCFVLKTICLMKVFVCECRIKLEVFCPLSVEEAVIWSVVS